jgi:hypothetical protein
VDFRRRWYRGGQDLPFCDLDVDVEEDLHGAVAEVRLLTWSSGVSAGGVPAGPLLLLLGISSTTSGVVADDRRRR